MLGRYSIFRTGHAQASAWPVVLVLLGAALVPAACVLWFMNAAMRNEHLAMRQRLADAYRQHLTVVRQRIEEDWGRRRRAVEAAEGMGPVEAFAYLVRTGAADGAVVFDERGRVAYPAGLEGVGEMEEITGEAWEEAVGLEAAGDDRGAAEAYGRAAARAQDVDGRARALQAGARVLARAGERGAAVEVLRTLGGGEYRGARDETGRLIAPGALLFACRLMGPGDPGRESVLAELRAMVEDYVGVVMSSAQRRLLLGELRDLTGEASPYLAAEELAAANVEVHPGAGGGLLPARDGKSWQARLAGGRVVALFRAGTFRAVAAAATPPDGARVELLSPAEWGAAGEALVSVPAGEALPEWRLAVFLDGDGAAGEGARARVALYLWTGAAGVVVIAGLTIAAGRYVTRQMTLTRLKNDLIATASHELKTPLASMRVLVESLLEEPGGAMPERVREYLQLIARENQRLSRLIDNFLTFSRMERNKRAFESVPVDVGEVVRLAVEAVGERFAGPEERLEVEVAAGLPRVRGDRDALVTAVVNLLDNAHKYTDERKQVRVSAELDGGEVVISVRDNGIGLTRAAARRVFDRFYQVDQSLSRRAGGCGLGLSIVKFIVEAHGGTALVVSRPGEGSKFVLRLPAVAEVGGVGAEEERVCPAARPS